MISAYAKDRISWFRATGKDQWGTVTHAETDIDVRVEWSNRWVVGRDGADVLSVGMLRMKEAPGYDDYFVIGDIRCTPVRVDEIKAYRNVVYYRVHLR